MTLTLIRLVEVIPHFCADEEILPLDLSILLLEKVADGVSNLVLVLVEPRTVEMAVTMSVSYLPLTSPHLPVTRVKGTLGSAICLSGIALRGKGPKSQRGDLDTVVESEGAAGRHCVSAGFGSGGGSSSGRRRWGAANDGLRWSGRGCGASAVEAGRGFSTV